VHFLGHITHLNIRGHIEDRRTELRPSLEHRPTDVVSQPLIVEDKVTDGIWKLLALLLALESPCFRVTPRACRLDRVRGGAEFVRCDVRNACCLTRCECGMPRRAVQLSCRPHRMSTRRAGLHHHPGFTAGPRPNLVDRLARPWIRGLR
jgi:hypothetical protein